MTKLYIVRLVGDNEDLPISVQLWLDVQSVPVKRSTTFGAYGGLAPGAEEICPFVLFVNGLIDLGTDVPPDGRYYMTNLYSGRRVELGELFSVWAGDDPGQRDEGSTYRVQSVTPLQV